MNEPEKLYRLRREDEYVNSGSDLAEGYVAYESCGNEPAHPTARESLWCCGNPSCEVRDIIVAVSYHGPATPRTKHCPGCGKPIRFVNYLNRVEFFPVREETRSIDEENRAIADMLKASRH